MSLRSQSLTSSLPHETLMNKFRNRIDVRFGSLADMTDAVAAPLRPPGRVGVDKAAREAKPSIDNRGYAASREPAKPEFKARWYLAVVHQAADF
jgi:hypothetical protein